MSNVKQGEHEPSKARKEYVFVGKLENCSAQLLFFLIESLPSKKESSFEKASLFLCPRRAELQASDSRYQAQRKITQLLQTELLQLYSRVEMEAPTSAASGLPAGGRVDARIHADSRSVIAKSVLSLLFLDL